MSNRYVEKFPVPDGFQEVLHDFSLEVLKDQPENIYLYGYMYFKAMEQGVDFEYVRKQRHFEDLKNKK